MVSLATKHSYLSSCSFICVSVGSIDAEDTWCLDQRGLLTLALTKETYERLGLVAVKAGSRRLARHYGVFVCSPTERSDLRTEGNSSCGTVVQVNIHDRTSHSFSRAKEAFRLWDESRERSGYPAWDIVFHSTDGK